MSVIAGLGESRLWRWASLGCVALGLCAGVASGEGRDIRSIETRLNELTAATALDELIEALDDEAFEVRERATALLLTSDHVSEQAVCEEISDESLTPEQSLRVERVLSTMFERTSRGAIGIVFAPESDLLLIVGQAVPGFPAVDGDMIRAGDAILKVEDQLITGNAGMTMQVQTLTFSRDPGEILPVTLGRMEIVRPDQWTAYPIYRIIARDLPLGSRDQHRQQVSGLRTPLLRASWRVRWDRLIEEYDIDTNERVLASDGSIGMAVWGDRTIEYEQRRAEYGPIVGAPVHPGDLDLSAARRRAMVERNTIQPRAMGGNRVAVQAQRLQAQRVQVELRGAGQVLNNIERGQNGEIIVLPNRVARNANGRAVAAQGGFRVMNEQSFEASDADDGVRARTIAEELASLQDQLRSALLAAGRLDRSDDAQRVALSEAEALARKIKLLREVLGALVDAEVESTDAGDVPNWPGAERVGPAQDIRFVTPPRRAR